MINHLAKWGTYFSSASSRLFTQSNYLAGIANAQNLWWKAFPLDLIWYLHKRFFFLVICSNEYFDDRIGWSPCIPVFVSMAIAKFLLLENLVLCFGRAFYKYMKWHNSLCFLSSQLSSHSSNVNYFTYKQNLLSFTTHWKGYQLFQSWTLIWPRIFIIRRDDTKWRVTTRGEKYEQVWTFS